MLETALTPTNWVTLLIAWVAAIASPGPDIFLLMRMAVRERRAAVLAALGIMTGNTLWIVASVLGISLVLAALPWLLPVLQTAGSLVLLWLGAMSLLGGIRGLRSEHPLEGGERPKRPYLLGFITNIANPKALIFFTALLSQFLPAEATAVDRIAIIWVMLLSGLLWFVGVALACSGRAFRHWLRRAAPWFDIVAGLVFMAVAVLVLAELLLTYLR
ncbi:LysE family translocator [Leucobacter sp. GX24907]